MGPRPGASPDSGTIRLDPVAAGQLAAALHQHRLALGQAGMSVHPEMARLLHLAVLTARSGQSRVSGEVRAHACVVIDDAPTVTLSAVPGLTGLSLRTVRRRVAEGSLPVVRVGRRVLVRRVDLDTLTA